MMRNYSEQQENIISRINRFVDNTDIRILVFVPPIIGFAALLIIMFIVKTLTGGNPYQPLTDIVLGITFLLPCFSGYAEIRKKAMPAPLGGIYQGKLAILSGILIIVMFGFLGLWAILHGLTNLLL